jgi:hypothetical protein
MRRAWLTLGLGACIAACSPKGEDGGDNGTEVTVVSVQEFPVRYVVTSVIYPPLGTGSTEVYGHLWKDLVAGPDMVADSDLGSRWRAVLRAAGVDVVATVGPVDGTVGGTAFVDDLTPHSVVRHEGPGMAWIFRDFPSDVPSHGADTLYVWVNPRATVTTYSDGSKRIDWAWSDECYLDPAIPMVCEGPFEYGLTAAQLAGKAQIDPRNPGAKFLSTLTSAERADILAYDPFFAPTGQPPALASDPRFQLLGTARWEGGVAATPSTAWWPCQGALDDATFPVYHQSAEVVAPGDPDTLLLQYSVVSTSLTCKEQRPYLSFGSTTPGCELSAQLYVDRMFGTFVFDPTFAADPCTRSEQ